MTEEGVRRVSAGRPAEASAVVQRFHIMEESSRVWSDTP